MMPVWCTEKPVDDLLCWGFLFTCKVRLTVKRGVFSQFSAGMSNGFFLMDKLFCACVCMTI